MPWPASISARIGFFGPEWLRRALTPSAAAWAPWPALRAVLAAALIAVGGIVTHHLSALALMYFGAACAVVFVTDGVYRTGFVALASQGLGAAAGLGVGAIGTSSDAGKVAVATVVGLACGMLGAIGRMATAFALMTVIGVAYTQFGHVPLPWWEQAGWYLAGTSIVSLAALSAGARPSSSLRPGSDRGHLRHERRLARRPREPGGPRAAPHAGCRIRRRPRRVLRPPAAAQAHPPCRPPPRDADARGGAHIVRCSCSLRQGRRGPRRCCCQRAWRRASGQKRDDPAAAGLFARTSTGLRSLAEALDVAAGVLPATLPQLPAWDERVRTAVRATTDRAALMSGFRLAWCMGLATAVTGAVHDPNHSYWLPLTVETVVRPENTSSSSAP